MSSSIEWDADCECGFFHEKGKCDKPERDAAIAAEQQLIRDYIKAHPWPSYKAMAKRLEKHVELWAEYGEANHMALKLCYENIFDKDICKSAGVSIAMRGGFQAMRANYYAFSCFGPFSASSNRLINCTGTLLEHRWDGIEASGHTWRA
jgi:hypothetical protein